jgi:6-phosphofructokinase 1
MELTERPADQHGHVKLGGIAFDIAGGATVILVPEEPFDLDAVCKTIRRRHTRGRYASIIVVAEGAVPVAGTMELTERPADQHGHVKLGGIAFDIAGEIELRTGFETRVVVLGHVQRGGTPNAYDRVLSTRYGLAAIDAVHDEQWGHMVIYKDHRMALAPLSVAVGQTRPVDTTMYRAAEVFFG